MSTLPQAPHFQTSLPGPNAKAIIARDGTVVSPSYTRGYPFVIARGEGSMVEDVDGNVFLDCAAGIAVNSTGHSHPEVVAAIVEQAGRYLHMSGTDFYYELQVQLAEVLSEIAPMPGPCRSFFGNSGAEANEAAIKLARYHSKRPFLIAFMGSFHGRTLGALSLTASRAVQRKGFGPVTAPGVFHVPYPDVYRAGPGAVEQSLEFLEDRTFVHLVAPEEVAAIVVEPIQGEGGYLVPPPEFLQRLREIADRHGILLIVDEVQAGMGRTGKHVRDRALRRAARHHHDGQGHCIGHAARRGDCARRPDGLDARRARQHLRRQSRVLRRGVDDDPAAAGTARGQRGRRRWLPARRACASCSTSTRSSATSAARA